MKSIQGKLLFQLIVGLFVMYGVVGFIFYHVVAHFLLNQFDEDLVTWVDTISEMSDFEDEETDFHFHDTAFDIQPFQNDIKYYQVWNKDGKIIARSLSLKEADLPLVKADLREHKFIDLELPQEIKVRAVAFSYINCRPIFEEEPFNIFPKENCNRLFIVLAASRERVDDMLGITLIFLAGTGVLLSVSSVFIVRGVVVSGLFPLNRIAEKTSSIDAADLSQRFPATEFPEELQPITERLNDLLERLDKAFLRERRFTSDAAHELRTPIAELRALAEVGLGIDVNQLDDPRPYFKDTLDIALQMQCLTDSLLTLARTDAGNLPVNVEEINLITVLNETWKKFEKEAKKRNIVHSLVCPDNTIIKSDKSIIAAIITNLISNAVSYSSENCTITMSIKRVQDNHYFLLSNPAKNLDIKDLEYIFQPFWRKDSARSDQSHSGIGLTLVKSYCQLLNISASAEMPAPDIFEMTLRIPAI